MATNLYYAPIPFTAGGGGAVITGYGVANIESNRVWKNWLGQAGVYVGVTCNLGAVMSPTAILVQACNFTAAAIDVAPANQIYSNFDTMTTVEDPSGRRRGLTPITGTAQYVRIGIAAGTPTDGTANWSIGAVYVFGEKIAPMAKSPRYGVDQEWVKPSNQSLLPNGQLAVASLGPRYTQLSLEYDDIIGAGDDVQSVYRAARRGPMCLSLGYQGWDFWPLELADQDARMRWNDYRVNRFSLQLREVV